MSNKRFAVMALAAFACAAAIAQPPQMAHEADFAPAAQRVQSPARAGAEQALREMSARWHDQAAGTLPRAFPFDVADVADMAQAHVGFGFQVYDADPQSLLGGDSLQHSAHATGTWRFAVMLQQRPIGLLTVAQTEQGWSVVSLGGAGLSKEIDAVVYAHGGKADTQLRYVRVPQATSDFIEVAGGGADARFVPLRAARESLRLATGSDAALLDERALQPLLRDAVSRGLAN